MRRGAAFLFLPGCLVFWGLDAEEQKFFFEFVQVCGFILLNMAKYVVLYYYACVLSYYYTFGLILPYMCPHNTVHVSSYYIEYLGWCRILKRSPYWKRSMNEMT